MVGTEVFPIGLIALTARIVLSAQGAFGLALVDAGCFLAIIVRVGQAKAQHT